VQRGTRRCPSGQHESPQRRRLGFDTIDQRLEAHDVGISERGLDHPTDNGSVGVGKPGPKGEQVSLDTDQGLVKVRVEPGGANQAEPRIQFVDLAVRVDTGIGLAHSPAAEQRRFTVVTGPGVQCHAWII
jgi:hypothetical protein